VIVFSILLSLIWLNEAEGNNAANVQAVAGVIFFLLINQVSAQLHGITVVTLTLSRPKPLSGWNSERPASQASQLMPPVSVCT
jgi:hypothetical protein